MIIHFVRKDLELCTFVCMTYEDATPFSICLQRIGAQFRVSEDNFGVGTGPIFLSRLECARPDDDTLLNCSRLSPIGLPACGHERDTGVHCEGIHVFMYRPSMMLGIGV